MAPIDPHSFADSSQPLSTHIALTLFLDFSSSTILGSALISLPNPHTGTLTLDSRSLSISSITSPPSLSPLPFSLPPPDPIKGSPLHISLSSHSSLLISFSTSPSSSALHWLQSPPFVYTQCQPIHARSIFPCQDTPAARIRYTALINLPSPLTAVLSAAKISRQNPSPGEAGPAVPDSVWCGPGRVVEYFRMDQAIPPYLFALAAGEMREREVGPRTRVYAAGLGEEVVEAAAREFRGAEEMVRVGEGLFGGYEWERFDLLVLPPSFPIRIREERRLTHLPGLCPLLV